MTTITAKDLEALLDAARERWKELHPSDRLEGMTQPLTEREFVALGWYSALLDFSQRCGGVLPQIVLVAPDSNPPEDDYGA